MTTTSTRARLLEAAQTVIADEGWPAATTRRVAELAGVNPGLVHYHAGTIEDLRRDAMVEGVRAFFTDSLHSISTRARDTGDSIPLADWLRAVVDVDLDDPSRARLARLLQESLVIAGRDAALRNSIVALLADYRAALSDALAAHGVTDPQGTAATIAAVVDGALVQKALDPEMDLTPLLSGVRSLVLARIPESHL